MIGVLAVVVLYLAVNAACLRVLGIHALALTKTPASDVAAVAFGPVGRLIIAAVIAISTLGFLSNQILTSPRVYFQMATDGTFFKALASVSARTHAPVLAIVRKASSRSRSRSFELQSDPQLRHLHRLHLLWIVGHRADRVSQPRRARSLGAKAVFPHAGSPGDDAALLGRRVVHRGRYDPQLAARNPDRGGHPPVGPAGVLALQVERGATIFEKS